MPQRKVAFVRGHYYHLYNRGAHRESIFYSDENFLYSLQLLKEQSRRYNIAVIAYCHMPNHYHWLVRQDGDAPVWLLAHGVWRTYAAVLNRARAHVGTIFTGRFQALEVADENYLRTLCLYIHANPVHHTLRTRPEDWVFSNYLDWIGQRRGEMVDRAFIEKWFGSPEQYVTKMNDYLLRRPETQEAVRDLIARDR